jgi:signal peptidase II
VKHFFKKLAFFVPVLIVIDQVTKVWAQRNLPANPVIFAEHLRFTYAENFGIAWSIAVPSFFLLIFVPAFLSIAAYFGHKEIQHTKSAFFFVSFLYAGAIGNWIDRLRLGFVIDFIDIWRWPIFNLADVFITLSAFLMIAFYAKIIRSH